MSGSAARPRFNPLHCGAVVASTCPLQIEDKQGKSFNPLHCGAVVASLRNARSVRRKRGVSIPFIAGQWSLRSLPPPSGGGATSFQSPSLRGSGRFRRTPPCKACASACFNPLHCGAVVASLDITGRIAGFAKFVSIPFIAGQWSLPLGMLALLAGGLFVSIPFIAGQWSLQETGPTLPSFF